MAHHEAPDLNMQASDQGAGHIRAVRGGGADTMSAEMMARSRKRMAARAALARAIDEMTLNPSSKRSPVAR